MITKTEKLTEMNMTLKETNELAKELKKEYDIVKKEVRIQMKGLDTLSDEYITLGHKWSSLIGLTSELTILSLTKRRSEKMKLDLIARVADVEDVGIELI